ncbi:TIGR00645 family protein [Nitrosovibrio sp. Nv6]|nr:TIGR00645 family protein [Nitrosovibrio sp. Nv6]
MFTDTTKGDASVKISSAVLAAASGESKADAKAPSITGYRDLMFLLLGILFRNGHYFILSTLVVAQCQRYAQQNSLRVKYRIIFYREPRKRMDINEDSGEPRPRAAARRIQPLAYFIFATRWLQLPLYLGLILAQCVYVYHFWVELLDLIGAVMGNESALQHILDAVAIDGAVRPTKTTETTIMLVVLGLIDVVMISNLLIMVIIGGYETFVSRMNLEGHPDQPEWLSHVNASVLKVKLATAIIGISSIHLLKTFINAKAYDEKTILAQTGIHLVFLLSAIAIAYSDRLMSGNSVAHKAKNSH